MRAKAAIHGWVCIVDWGWVVRRDKVIGWVAEEEEDWIVDEACTEAWAEAVEGRNGRGMSAFSVGTLVSPAWWWAWSIRFHAVLAVFSALITASNVRGGAGLVEEGALVLTVMDIMLGQCREIWKNEEGKSWERVCERKGRERAQGKRYAREWSIYWSLIDNELWEKRNHVIAIECSWVQLSWRHTSVT